VALPLPLSVSLDIRPARNTSRQAKSVGASKIGGSIETEGKIPDSTATSSRIRYSTAAQLAADRIKLALDVRHIVDVPYIHCTTGWVWAMPDEPPWFGKPGNSEGTAERFWL